MDETTATKGVTASGISRGAGALAFAVVLALIGAAGYSYFLYHQRVVVAEKYKELAAIADLKAAQISEWRRDHLKDAGAIYSSPMIARQIAALDGRQSPAAEEVRAWLTMLRESAGFSQAAIVSPEGRVAFSSPADPLSSDTLSRITEAAAQQKVVLTDFHRDAPTGRINLNLIVPMLASDGKNRRCIATLALEIDPRRFLYPLLQSWPTASETAETILVERDGDQVLYLSDVRYGSNSAMTMRRPLSEKNMPAVRAVLGQEGVFEGVDYRGVPVLAATRSIPGSPWAFIAKVDKAEVLQPVSRRAWFVALLCAMTALTSGLLMYLWWMKKKELHLRQQYQTELQHNIDLKQAELSLHLAHFELEQRVSERTGELTRANNQLRKEIAERRQLELKLIEAKQLETVGQLAGGVAHEVRNPLNAILSITEALFKEQEIENHPEYEPYLQHIRSQVNRLAHLMNDLLDLGKPILDSNLQPVLLAGLCRETVDLWKQTGLSANRQVELSCSSEGENVRVMADSMKLQQVIFNLLENAGYHSPNGSSIELRVDQGDETGVVTITDRGPGIPEDKLPRVFEPFYSDRRGGTGLGLTLVRHFTEHMGGAVALWNNQPPPGCTVQITIPCSRRDR